MPAPESPLLGAEAMTAFVEGFGCRPSARRGLAWRVGVRKPAGEEAAVSRQSLWGLGAGRGADEGVAEGALALRLSLSGLERAMRDVILAAEGSAKLRSAT